MHVFNLRAYTAPLKDHPDLSFEFEYASERNGEALHSNAWTAQASYELSDVTWKPTFTYRYAFFQGDDPETTNNEAFDPLMLGFYDWGYWCQGEIAGEYFVSNSNLISHQLRVHAQPSEAISTGLIFYDFRLDDTQSAGVTADDVAIELDWYMDWSVNDNFLLSFVAAVAEPGDAIEQSSGRTDTFWYGMAFAAYSF